MTQKIAVLIPEFPSQTHAFFWREIAAIEDAGPPVQILSTRRVPPEACPHAFREAAVARTAYLFPPALGPALGVLARPGRLFAAIGYVLGLSETPLKARLKLLGLIPSAAQMLALCRANDVAHVHIHSCANAAHLGALGTILGDLPYSLTLHGNLPVYGTDHGAKFARAKFVSAVTQPLAEEIHSVAPNTPAPVIMMGVDGDRFTPPDRPPRQAEQPLKVVTVARLNPTKGHRFLLRAVAQLKAAGGPEIRVTIAGEGPARGEIEAEIATLGLSDQVTLLGTISEDQVRDVLRAADALALTSIGQGEAAPVAVMEAMACGRPVVSSIIGGTPDMIADGVDGFLVAQEDVAGIASALEHLATDPERAAQIGQAARETALRIFDYRSNAAKLLDQIQNAGA